jgi:hypothetical protein
MTEDDRRLGHRLAGDYLEASHDVDAARLGVTRVEPFALVNMSFALAGLGRVAEARAMASRAANLGKEHQNPRAEGSPRTQLSHLALEAGEVDVALAEAKIAVEVLAKQPLLLAVARATYASALLQAESGDHLDQARAEIHAAMAIVKARDSLLARAARITNPAWRESFLTRVPENVETLRLVEAGA